MKLKEIYNYEIEEEIDEYLKELLYLEENSLIFLTKLMDLYEKTKYPGIYYYIGKLYYDGIYGFEKDEILGLNYLKKSIEEGYCEAFVTLGEIYTSKAMEMLSEARTYYEQLALEHDDMISKLDLGTNLIASYLIDSSAQHYNNYDQYYTGLGLIAESFQRGNFEANIILNVLDKDKKFVEDYVQRINESKSKLVHEIYSCSEDDLD